MRHLSSTCCVQSADSTTLRKETKERENTVPALKRLTVQRKRDREDTHERTSPLRTSLVAQWWRIRLPMPGTRVRALVREDPTYRGTTKPVRHNYWAHVPQLLKTAHLEPVLRNKRSHFNEKPAHHNEEQPPLAATRESPCAATKTQCSQK